MADFFQIHVPIWQYTLSQVIGVFVIISMVFVFQSKNKVRMLLLMALASLLSVFMQVLLENYAVAGIAGVTFFKSLSFAWTTKKGASLPPWVGTVAFLVFSSAAVVPVVLLWHHWVEFAILGAQIFANFTQWRSGTHMMRLSGFLFAVLMIANNIMFLNGAGMIISMFTIISVIIFYVRHFRQKKIQDQTQPSLELNSTD